MDNNFYSNILRTIVIKSKKIADAKLNNIQINSQQAKIIGYIYENQEQGVIQKDLAKKFNRTNASITSMLQGLEKKGYIKRVISENNERAKKLYVLEKGKLLVEEFNIVFNDIESQMLNMIDDKEKILLKKLLLKIDKNLE